MSDEHLSLKVPIGDESRTFGVGDYLNAVDFLTCDFLARRECSEQSLANALRLYADGLDDDGIAG